MPLGHLFVVRGNVFHLQCTARVVSGAGGNHPEPSGVFWGALTHTVPERGPASREHCFRLWSRGQRVEVQPEPDTWVVNVVHANIVEIVSRVEALILAIAEDHQQRVKDKLASGPLSIAIPFLGTGGAGSRSEKAPLLELYLSSLEKAARRTGAAVILVFFYRGTNSSSSKEGAAAYAMAQAIRKKDPQKFWASQKWGAILPTLERSAAAGRLAVFVGAGVSRAAGLPGWGELLEQLRHRCALVCRQAGEAEPPPWEELRKIELPLCAQVIQEWWPGKNKQERQESLRKAVIELVDARRYGLQHALLTALPVRDYVTTNYDRLLENASADNGRPLVVIPSAELSPWNSDEPEARRLLKLHGTVDSTNGVVLTSLDYLRFSETYAALGGAVQGLMLGHHLLFVGFGMTDPNFLKLHDSVARLLPEAEGPRKASSIGTALLVESQQWKVDFAEKMLSGIQCVRPVGGDLQEEEERVPQEARWLEILLDRLVVASFSSLAYAGDDKFKELMGEPDRQLVELVRGLVTDGGTPLQQKLKALQKELGMRR